MSFPPKRFRPAFFTAWVATLVAVGLVVGPTWGGAYDPLLAVITATLVAVIWYTYFTYRAVHAEETSRLVLDLELGPARQGLIATVTNPTEARTLTVRFFVDQEFDGEVPLAPLLALRGEKPIALMPGQRVSSFIQTTQWHTGEQERRKKLKVWLRATWVDDLGESGETPKLLWTIDLDSFSFDAISELASEGAD